MEETGYDYFRDLTSLEAATKALAPASMKRWDGLQFAPYDEPEYLVDALLDDYPAPRARAERQAAIYRAHVVPSITLAAR